MRQLTDAGVTIEITAAAVGRLAAGRNASPVGTLAHHGGVTLTCNDGYD